MILDVKNRVLVIRKDLTAADVKMLGLLASNDLIPYSYLIDNTNYTTSESVRAEICRLKQKTGIDVEIKHGKGIILNENLFIDY